MIKYFKKTKGLSSINIVFEGANVEEPKEWGCAHLLEHLMFKKLKNIESEAELNGLDLNAETHSDYTVYTLQGLDSRVEKMAQKFYDLLLHPRFNLTEKDFQSEKKVIIQEWREMVSESNVNAVLRFYSKHYRHGQVIGALESIESINFEDFKSFYKKWFTKPLYCLIEQRTSWRIDNWAEYKESHDSCFSFNSGFKHYLPKLKSFGSREYLLISDSFFSGLAEKYLISQMLSDGFLSPLMKKLRVEQQLIYGIHSTVETVTPGLNHILFLTSTEPKNKDKIWKTFCATLENKRSWLTEKRFNEAKQHYLIQCEMEEEEGKRSLVKEFLNPELEEVLNGVKK